MCYRINRNINYVTCSYFLVFMAPSEAEITRRVEMIQYFNYLKDNNNIFNSFEMLP